MLAHVIEEGAAIQAPSSGQQTWIGKSSKESCRTTSREIPELTVVCLALNARATIFRLFQMAGSFGGTMESAKSISSRPISSGSLPRAKLMRFAEAYTLTARGNCDPFTFSKSSAGFCSLSARTVISVTSSRGST